MKKKKKKPPYKLRACGGRGKKGCCFTGFDLMKGRTFETLRQAA